MHQRGFAQWRTEQFDTVFLQAHFGGHDTPAFVCKHNGCRDLRWSDVAQQLGITNSFTAVTDEDDDDGGKALAAAPGDDRHDAGNAQRLLHFVKGDVRYSITQKVFYVWNGECWIVDEGAHLVTDLAKKAVQAALIEAALITDSTERKDRVNWARQSSNEPRLRNAVQLLKSHPECHIDPSEFDADPFLLGVKNGLIDLRTGEFRKATREDLITKHAGCAFDENAECPRWWRFIREATRGDQELINFLRELVGYVLTGATTEQILVFVYGEGGNGKSVFIEVVRRLLGDYAKSLRTDVIARTHCPEQERRDGGHRATSRRTPRDG